MGVPISLSLPIKGGKTKKMVNVGRVRVRTYCVIAPLKRILEAESERESNGDRDWGGGVRSQGKARVDQSKLWAQGEITGGVEGKGGKLWGCKAMEE